MFSRAFQVYLVLSNFEIEKKQIYTIKLDNTTNFVQLVNLIKDDQNIDEHIYGENSIIYNFISQTYFL